LGYARGETHKISQPAHSSGTWIARFHAALSMASSLVILIQKYIISNTQKYTYHAKTVEVIQSATILTITCKHSKKAQACKRIFHEDHHL
jgi:hypothetical protein